MGFERLRIAQGGSLPLDCLNKQRAFTLFHTFNLPPTDAHVPTDLPLLLQKMVHVAQYARAGSVYIRQALSAQHKKGYGYGGLEWLIRDC